MVCSEVNLLNFKALFLFRMYFCSVKLRLWIYKLNSVYNLTTAPGNKLGWVKKPQMSPEPWHFLSLFLLVHPLQLEEKSSSDSDPAQGDSDPTALTRSDQVQKPQNSDPALDQEEQVGDFRLDSFSFFFIFLWRFNTNMKLDQSSALNPGQLPVTKNSFSLRRLWQEQKRSSLAAQREPAFFSWASEHLQLI